MQSNHVVVWLDKTLAHVIHFNLEHSETEDIKATSTRVHPNERPAQSAGQSAQEKHYFDGIANSLKDALEILIVGPGLEKTAFSKYLATHFHTISERVVGVETVDHPSNGQLLAFAKKCFLKIDQMR